MNLGVIVDEVRELKLDAECPLLGPPAAEPNIRLGHTRPLEEGTGCKPPLAAGLDTWATFGHQPDLPIEEIDQLGDRLDCHMSKRWRES